MAPFEYLDQAEEDALHSSRLLSVEEKAYKRLQRRLLDPKSIIQEVPSHLPSPPPEDKGDTPETTTPAPLSDDSRKIEREQWREDALLDFANYDFHLMRAHFTFDANERERLRYSIEKEKIQQTAQQVRAENAQLHVQLAKAQATLSIRKGYDSLADQITSNRHLRPRDEQAVQLEKLTSEIKELEREREEYGRTWRERRTQFEKIVDEGQQMLRLIRDEKEEAERMEGLEDVDTGDEAGRGSGMATPRGNTTPKHVSQAAEASGARREEPKTAEDLKDAEDEGEIHQSGAGDADVRMAEMDTDG